MSSEQRFFAQIWPVDEKDPVIMSNNGIPRVMKFLRATNGGLTQERVAERLNVSTSLIAKFETGRLIPMPDTARQLDDLFGSGDLIQGLASDARKSGSPVWLREWIEIEREAASLRWFEPAWIPGLLQTEQYARATLEGELLTVEEIDRLVSARLGRQAVLEQQRPPLLVAVFDIDAVRCIGRGDLLREQIEQLIAMSTLPNVQIHVVPANVGMYPGLGGPFIVAEAGDGSRAAHADSQLAAQITDRPAEVATLMRRWDRIMGVALPVDQSLQVLKEVAES